MLFTLFPSLLLLFSLLASHTSASDSIHLTELRQEAEAGNLQAMTDLGVLLVEEKNQPYEGVRWLRQAALKEFEPAYYSLGMLYYIGVSGKPNYTAAAHWLELSGEAGNSEALNALASIHAMRRIPNASEEKALSLWKRAVQNGYPPAIFNLALAYTKQQTEEGYLRALPLFEKAAKLGDHRAMAHLGEIYIEGRGTPVDLERAVTWLERADGAGNAEATFVLAQLYYSGTGVTMNKPRAIALLEKAIERGNRNALFYKNLLDNSLEENQ